MLNQVQIAILPKGFHGTVENRRMRKLAKKKRKLNPIVNRLQVAVDKKTGKVKKIIHEIKKK